ncbi:MAG: 5-formyltetrahydrofolate cyclo-ligase [Lactobacillus sp.]|nr:5-formyltetrahydrofolate cyclo-ligase [Lactobacillus sp.]
MEDKATFRKKQLQKLAQAKQETNQVALNLATKLFLTPEWQQAKTIGITRAGELEIPTDQLIRQAENEGKVVYYPKTMPKRQMVFLPAKTEADFELSSFGILEPHYDETKVNDNLDLLLVPGIAYALDSGLRVGFGGGYYDRYLKNFSGNTISLATPTMTYATAGWELDSFDVPVQWVITVDN